MASRLPVDELDELFGVDIDDEDIDTVGGLMAKHLGRVPIPGAAVVCEGLRFRAESLPVGATRSSPSHHPRGDGGAAARRTTTREWRQDGIADDGADVTAGAVRDSAWDEA